MASLKLFFPGILLAVLFAGCISIHFDQAVDRDGNSAITQKIDLSTLAGMEQQSGSNLSDVCVNLTASRPDIECMVENDVVIMKRQFKASDGDYTFTRSSELPYIIYTLEIRKIPDLGKGLDTSEIAGAAPFDMDLKNPQMKKSALGAKMVGATMTYNISMPGEIFSAEHGQIKDGTAQFNLLEMMEDGNYLVVKSREPDLVVVGAAALLVLAVAGAAAFFVLKRK
ncbi:MAG TPA: hypothetical protein VLD37_04215 [Candidatus Bilamarchaeum sp.]|nr:hypothetical protein [Candidatus Bilamarchaeum sp.]